ncbi:MAG: hypothetical protein HYT12_00840 [Candidatus Liptonbacteria bacterium]|nr:hypothetical protein [Candidatus Liptonbacteria bacterium]
MKGFSKNAPILSGVIIILALVLFFYQISQRQTPEAPDVFNSILKTVSTGKFSDTIKNIERVLGDKNINEDTAFIAKHSLARSLWWRNENGDRKRSLSLFRELILSENILPIQRSTVASGLAALLEAQLDDEFQRSLVFNDGKFGDFIGETNNPRVGIHNLLVFADNLYPAAFSKIMLAEAKMWLVADGDYKNKIEEAQYAEAAESLISEALLTLEADARKAGLDKLALSDLYARAGSTYAALSLRAQDKNGTLFGLAEDNFKKAIQLAEDAGKENSWYKEYAKGGQAAARLRYAQALTAKYGDKKLKEIKELLAPIIVLQNSSFTKIFFDHVSALRAYGRTNPESLLYKTTAAMGALDSGFNNFLKQNDW